MIHQLTAKNLNQWSELQCQVSLRRINKFINSEELDPHAVDHDRNVEAAVLAKSQYLKPLENFGFFIFSILEIIMVGQISFAEYSLMLDPHAVHHDRNIEAFVLVRSSLLYRLSTIAYIQYYEYHKYSEISIRSSNIRIFSHELNSLKVTKRTKKDRKTLEPQMRHC